MTTVNGKRKQDAEVIVIGAGPVGMLTALRLGQAGIKTLVLEGHDALLNTTRAIVYMPVVISVLRELGILEKVMKEAYLNTEGVTWRDIDGKPLANLPISSNDPNEFGGVLLLGQWRMNELVLEELKNYPTVEVRFNLKLSSITNDPSSPTISLTAEHPKDPSSTTTLTTSYILGTDGANSKTRSLLSVPFDGFTYDNFRMIGADVIYDFIRHKSFTPLNFVVHPEDWAVIAYTAQSETNSTPSHDTMPKDAQWRVAYVESPSLPSDQSSINDRAAAQMKKYTGPDADFRIIRAEPYTIQQRHAQVPMVHRVALAGDALHSNNPIGGLGLTGGILDAFCYGNAFIRALRNNEGPEIVMKCAQARLTVWKDVTDKLSQANLERLYADSGPAAEQREQMFASLNGSEREGVMGKVRGGMEAMLGERFGDGVGRFITQSSG